MNVPFSFFSISALVVDVFHVEVVIYAVFNDYQPVSYTVHGLGEFTIFEPERTINNTMHSTDM